MSSKQRELLAETQRISIIANDCVKYFALKFPGAHWSVWLDRAVDRLIEITGVNREIADRVSRARLFELKTSDEYATKKSN
jgi:hypothetical protein